MLHKELHPARRVFRGSLLVTLGISIALLGMVITMRIIYKDRAIEGPMQIAVFEADIVQYKVLTYFSDDHKDMEIAEELLANGLFSPLYSQAGMHILKKKAAAGYEPAIERLALLEKPPVQER